MRIEPSGGIAPLRLSELWGSRELLAYLTWRNLRVHFRQAVLGTGWVVVQPVLTMVLFAVFFGRLIGVPSEGAPYPVFAYAAILPWTLFSQSVARGTGSLVESATTITKIYFPRLLVPLAAVLARLVDFGISMIVLFGLMAYYGIAPGIRAFAVLGLLPLTLALCLATSIWLGALNVRYRDVQVALPFILQSWFFATPVVYPASLVPDRWQLLYSLNPMVGVVNGFRWALLDGPSPARSLFLSVAITLVALVTGLYYFRTSERTFADRI